MSAPACIWPLAAELGEGPVWVAAEAALYFVDIKGRAVHRCAADGGQRHSWAAPEPIGFLLPLARGGFVAGLKSGLHRFDPASGRFQPWLAVEPTRPGNRLNDAHVDATGGLWFGSMDDAEVQPTGSLYHLAPDGRLAALDAGYVITNGPCLSPDGRTLYHTDTLARRIYAFDVQPGPTDGPPRLGHKRLFAETDGGWPDGSSVDAEGFLWVCFFGGGRVDRYSRQGKRVASVRLPCSNVTKLAFGGADLRTAFVTTAWKGLDGEQRRAEPLAGGLFSFPVDTPGLPGHALRSTVTDPT